MARSGRIPFADISNAIDTDTKDTSNTTPVALDQIERKRQRERERYAGMSAEQKEEKNKKCREARLMKKNVQAQCNENKHPGVEDKILATGVETDISPSTADETADWLQRNDSYAQEFSRSIDVPEGYQGTDTTLGDMTVNTTIASHILDVYQGTIDNMGEDDSIPSKDPRTGETHRVCPKERRRQRARAQREAMTAEKRELINKCRRDAYHAKKSE